MERILLRFTKGEPLRFVGHLDLMRVLERAMRRADFPVAYSQGFNPRPRMSFASALTLGATSGGELCQLDLAGDIDPCRLESATARLRSQLPQGMEVLDIWALPLEKRNPYIQVYAAEYELTLLGDGAASRLEQFFTDGPGLPQALECALEQRGESSDEIVLKIKLPVGERNGVRIRDLITEFEEAAPGIRVIRLHRVRLWCEQEPAHLNYRTDNSERDASDVRAAQAPGEQEPQALAVDP